jgi:hypothetical protein
VSSTNTPINHEKKGPESGSTSCAKNSSSPSVDAEQWISLRWMNEISKAEYGKVELKQHDEQNHMDQPQKKKHSVSSEAKKN